MARTPDDDVAFPQATRSASPASISRRSLMGAMGAGAMAMALPGASRAGAQEATPETTTAAGIAVFPAHGTRTASPGTEISFRGVEEAALTALHVAGSASGSHSGVLVAHSDGGGFSFVPDAPFLPGEWVTVRAGTPLRPTPRGSVTFRIGVPSTPVMTPVSREIDQPQTPPRAFRSRLDLLPPPMTVTDRTGELSPGYVFLGAKVADGHNGAMILDNDGELVWFSPQGHPAGSIADVRVQQYRGRPVLTMWQGMARQGTGFGHLLLLDEAYETVATVQVGNGYPGIDQHECQLTDSGTALLIVYNPLQWDLTPVGGSVTGRALDGVIQEIDIETGCVIFEWHSLDHIAVEESYGTPDEEAEEAWDYFHVNSIGLTEDNNFIISARHTHAIYSIERSTGRVLWRLNGKVSDFSMGEGAPFFYQHDARVHPDGLVSLFDNVSSNQDDAAEKDSRGLILHLDEASKQATVAREYIHPTGILSVSQGNMQVLPNGNVFVGWGSAPVFSEFGPDGDLRFNGRFPAGGTSYRAYRCEWTGRPAEPPAVAVETGLGADVTVYMSWNGATEVVHWRVLGGESPEALEALTEGQRTGFETAMTVELDGDYLAVEALGADGSVLGASEVVTILR